MGTVRWVLCLALIAFASSTPADLTGLRWLFPETKTYVLDLKANTMTGSLLPAKGGSYRTMHARLSVHVLNDTDALLQLEDVKTTVHNDDKNAEMANTMYELPAEAQNLTVPWEASYELKFGMLNEIRLIKDEPLWSSNMKKALTISLQLVRVESTGPFYRNGYTVIEPCLQDTCAVEYSGVDTGTVRKWHGVQTPARNDRSVWYSVRPDVCDKQLKQPFIGSAERVYKLDDRGLLSLDLNSSLEYHSHGNLLSVITSMSLCRDEITQLKQPNRPDLVASPMTSFVHSPKEKTGGRAPPTQQDLLDKTRDLLTTVSESIDNANFTRIEDRIHDTNLIKLHHTMSQLSFASLKVLNNELHVGTSYLNETNKNLFLEVLPHVKSADSARLVKFLVMDFTDFKLEEATALSLIRKLPFNIKEYSQELLVSMESMLNLPPDVSREIRHTSILSFATLAHNTYVNFACSNDEFEEYVQKYLRMYTECPKYEDRLVWLQGLANLQVGSVSRYLGPIIQDKRVSRHERFLAIWATMPVADSNPEMSSSIYWPILTDGSEHLQLRVAALLMLLQSDQTASRVLSLHRYVAGSGDGHLQHFWYSTVRSVRQSGYGCFSTISKSLSYVSGLVQAPDSKYWATANRLVDVADEERQHSALGQLLTISKPLGGLPEFLYLSLHSNQAGLSTSQISVMIKAEGVDTSIFSQLTTKREDFSYESILEDLKKMEISFKDQQSAHYEVIVIVQGKTVYAGHRSGYPSLEDWAKRDIPGFKTIHDILTSDSHINQQYVQYPLQAEIHQTTELGTPVTLETIWSSFVSMRGTTTSSITDETQVRKYDIHLRYRGTAVTTLSSYDPIINAQHAVSIQQSTLTHAPIKFDLAHFLNFDSAQPGFIRFSWLNDDPTGGIVVHSRTQVATKVGGAQGSNSTCPECRVEYTVRAKDDVSTSGDYDVLLDCERLFTSGELLKNSLDPIRATYAFLSPIRSSLLLPHLLNLVSAPRQQPCGLMLQSRFPLHLTPGTRLELKLMPQKFSLGEDGNNVYSSFSLLWRDNPSDTADAATLQRDQTSEEHKLIDGSLNINYNESHSSTEIIIFATDKGDNGTNIYEFSVNHTETLDLSNDKDIYFRPVPYEGRIDVLFNRIHPAEYKSGLKLTTAYSGRTDFDTNEVTRYLNVSISVERNLPTDSKTKNDVGSFGVFDTILPDRLTKNASLVDKNGQTTVIVDGVTVWRFSLGDLAEALDELPHWGVLKKYGFLQACRIQDGTVETLDSSITELQEEEHSRSLIMADCSDTPSFAVYRRDGSYEFSSNRTVVTLTGQSSHPDLRLNGEQAPYPFNDHFIKVEKRASGVIIHFKMVGLWIYHQRTEVLLLVPDSYSAVLCGACVGDHYHIDTLSL